MKNNLVFLTSITGEGLSGRAQIQAMKFGSDHLCLPKRVTGLDCRQYPMVFSLVLEQKNLVL